MNQTTKYGLIFVGGILLGALGAAAYARGDLKVKVKPMASELLSEAIDLKDKLAARAGAIKEDLEDVLAEAQIKSQGRRQKKELAQAAKSAPRARRVPRKAKAAA